MFFAELSCGSEKKRAMMMIGGTPKGRLIQKHLGEVTVSVGTGKQSGGTCEATLTISMRASVSVCRQ